MVHPALQPNTLIHQRYEIVRLIASGGMGGVYIARDTQIANREVALKSIQIPPCDPNERPKWIKMVEIEAEILAKLDHPAIPFIFDFFTWQHRYCIVMSLVPGQTLKDWLAAEIQKHHAAEITDVMRIICQVCRVVEYLHAQRPVILFRDMKPANVMIRPDGTICLIDFGISGYHRGSTTTQATQEGTMSMGSPGHAAPEQWSDLEPTDVRTDVYGLCATLHELLTGQDPARRPPFTFPKPSKLVGDIPPALDEIVMKGLAGDKGERWQTVAELRQALENYQQPTTLAQATAPTTLLWQPDGELQGMLAQITMPAAENHLKEWAKTLRSENQAAFHRLAGYCHAGLLENAYQEAKSILKALERLAKADHRDDPNDPDLLLIDDFLFVVGKLEEAHGRLEAAQKCYEASIVYEPQRQLAYQALVRVKNAPAVAKAQKAAARAQASQATRSRFAQGLQSHFNWSDATQLIWGPRWFILDLTVLFAVIAGGLWGQLTTPVTWSGSDDLGATLALLIFGWAWLGISRLIISGWRNKQKTEGFYYTLLILISMGIFVMSVALTHPPIEKSRVENAGERGAKLARVAHVAGDERPSVLRVGLTKARNQIITEDYLSARNSVVNTFRRWQEQLKLRDPAYAAKEHAQLEEYLRVFKMTPTPETIPATAFHRSAAEIVLDEQEIAAIEHALATYATPAPGPTASPEPGVGEHGLSEAAPSPDPGAVHDKDLRTGSDFDKVSVPRSETTPEPPEPVTIPMPASSPSPEWGPDISP